MDKIHIRKRQCTGNTDYTALWEKALRRVLLSAAHRKNRLSESHGFYQRADSLCRLEGGFPLAAGQRVSFGLHQQTDKREHAPVVRRHADLGSKRGGY